MISSRTTVLLFLGSAALLAGFYVVLAKMEGTLEAQLANRMALAVDQLGKDDLELRLGGIYTLEGLARTSESEYGPIMAILTAFVRERASVTKTQPPKEPQMRLATDLQAALDVIGRRRHAYGDGESQRLDLRRTDLRRVNLAGAKLAGAILSEVRLEEANLAGINLEGAILRAAHLEHSNLADAKMQGAFLLNTSLTGARLRNANLQGAFLGGARFDDADLLGADLTDATGLTWEQLKLARKDNRTRFPDYLNRPVKAD
jgi:hypothetical protein